MNNLITASIPLTQVKIIHPTNTVAQLPAKIKYSNNADDIICFINLLMNSISESVAGSSSHIFKAVLSNV